MSWAAQHSFLKLCLLLSAPTILGDCSELALFPSPRCFAATCRAPWTREQSQWRVIAPGGFGIRTEKQGVWLNLNWLGPATLGVITPITPVDFCYGNRRDFQPLSPWESVLQIQTQVPFSYMGSL